MAKTSRYEPLIVADSLLCSRIFAGLPAADIAEISSFSSVRNFEKNDYLFREGEPCEGFFVVQRGVINIHRVSAAGKVQVIHVFHSRRLLRGGCAYLQTKAIPPARAR